MNRTIKRRREDRNPDLIVCSEWSLGPRTDAWERLWQLILDDLDRQLATVPPQRVGRENADG